jgi:hypothetical protein
MTIPLADAPGGARLIAALAAAAKDLSLLYANTPDEKAREHLGSYCASIEAGLTEAIGVDNAARIIKAVSAAVMARKHEIERGVA